MSILPNLSKVYERCMYNQISVFFEQIFSKYQCGFRKGFSAQTCLVAMLEKWKKNVDNGASFGALLTDLSKAFDCLAHDLLIAKLHAYGFDMNALRFINNYLSDRLQRIRINNTYSSWKELIFGVPQGSILGPLLFNIYLLDMFFFLADIDIASYADDNTPYTSAEDINEVIKSLETSSARLFTWFENNYFEANVDKCHLISTTTENHTALINCTLIHNSNEEKLLGVNIDSKLNFKAYVSNLCA